jgi:hypothetical protein
MIKSIILSVLLAITIPCAGQDKTISGIKIPGKVLTDNQELLLNGAGVREKYFMDMYVCSLYLTGRTADADKICSADESSVLKIQIVSSLVSTKAMQSAVEEGFGKSTSNKTGPIRNEIDEFIAAFNDPIVKGDVFEIRYSARAGTTIFKNGTKKKNIAGLPFKKAMMGIWLGKEPAQKDLKENLLGKY